MEHAVHSWRYRGVNKGVIEQGSVKAPLFCLFMKNSLIISLFLIISVVGIFPTTSVSLRFNHQLLAIWTVMVLFALFFIKSIWLKGFLVWMVVRTAIAFIGKNFGGDFYITLNTIFIFLIFYQLLMNEAEPLHLLNAICIITLLHLLWMAMQYFGLWVFVVPKGGLSVSSNQIFLKEWPIHILITQGKHTITGLMGNPNITSALLALGLPAFFRRGWFWFIPLIWIGLVIAHSLGGTIPAMLAMLWLAWNKSGKYKYWIFPACLLLFMGYIVKTEVIKNIGSSRFPMWWAVTRDLIPKHWIIGWVVGEFEVRFMGQRWNEFHNEYLELWFEQGIIALGLIMGFIISTVVGFWRTVNKSWISRIALIGVATVLLNSGVNFLFHVTPGIVGIVWFVILRKSLQEKEVRNVD